jgi:EAL and modified HD-GYP domain-containing signal transduction protein
MNGSGNTSNRTTSLLARQPIYESDLSVFGYELLFRTVDPSSAAPFDHNLATTSVLVTAFVDIGLQALVGNHRAFVNFPRDFLIGIQPIPDSPDKLVVEILEDIIIDEQLIEGISQLKSQGYMIALDDVVYSDMLIPIMHLVDIVKVEYPAIENGKLEQHVARFRQWPVQILAEKIETREEFDECNAAGFDLFQGFFLSHPEVIHSKVSDRQSSLLPVLARLNASCETFDQLEEIVRSDADLCFRMMRYRDSSSFGLNREIHSLRHGLVLLGFGGVRRLITLLVLKSVPGTPGQRLVSSLKDAAYTTGLFSQLDSILQQPMEDVMKSLPLSAEIRDAILAQTGTLGQILQTAVAYETADWALIDPEFCPEDKLSAAYLQAVQSADALLAEIDSVAT